MKKLLIKVRDKRVVMSLKQFGEVETVSAIFNIYAINVDTALMPEIKKVNGVISVEEEEYFEVQNFCLT